MKTYHDIVCPYCHHPQDINHDDGYGYEEGQTHQQECGQCEKTFAYTTSISYHYEADKADCKNGQAEHKWSLQGWFRAECTVCGDTRQQTEAEKQAQLKKYQI